MNINSGEHGFLPSALQQWVDSRVHLSGAIQAYVSATTFLESMCTPFSIKSLPEVLTTIETNLEIMEREELCLQKAQVPLKKKRNASVSLTHTLPSELLAYIFTTVVGPTSYYTSTLQYERKSLSQVCSRWRQIALDVCPIWGHICLTFWNHHIFETEAAQAEIQLYRQDRYGSHTDSTIYRQPGLDDAQYIRTVLATIAPHIKRLTRIDLAAENVGELQLFLNFWLQNGAPGSLTELSLSLNNASLIFPKTNPDSSDHLYLFLREIKALELSSVGLDWSSIVFGKLTSMWLAHLPPSSCLTLGQLAQILSSCPYLQTIGLESAMTPAFLDSAAIVLVELEHLRRMRLQEVDISGVLSIISPPARQLDLELGGAISNTNTLESLRSFFGRANIGQLTLTLSEPRPDGALAQLLYSISGSIRNLECLSLVDMCLRDFELNALANLPSIRIGSLPPLASADSTDGAPRIYVFELRRCDIYATALELHSAITILSWDSISFAACNHFVASHGEADGVAGVPEEITESSEFGTQLSELMSGRVHLDP
ncbi:hypothetical protein BDV93DRAFT_545796 [Ceratobasidium sp. AG-I]|nr:hypothetical protein BDV93DRAFT_545796 [Ceratobasidium sp. AG-I]